MPLAVAYLTVTGLVEACDSDTVNPALVLPELPSATAALAIDTVGVAEPCAVAMMFCHLVTVVESLATMLFIDSRLRPTPCRV